MKNSSGNGPKPDSDNRILYHRNDGPEFYEPIRELLALKYYVRRPSKHHIKHREVNFWPTTGTITIDVIGRHPEKGQQAFVALIKKMYPKRRLQDPAAQPATEEPQPSPLTLEIDLDHSDETSDCGHDPAQDGKGDPPW